MTPLPRLVPDRPSIFRFQREDVATSIEQILDAYYTLDDERLPDDVAAVLIDATRHLRIPAAPPAEAPAERGEVDVLSPNYEAGFHAGMRFEANNRLLAAAPAAPAEVIEPRAWLYELPHDGESDHYLSARRFLPSWVAAKGATETPLYTAPSVTGGTAVAWQCRILNAAGEWHSCSLEQYDHIRLTGHYNGPGGAMCEARELFTHAPAKAREVTDEMVQSGIDAFNDTYEAEFFSTGRISDNKSHAIRAVLGVALATFAEGAE